MKFQRGKTIVNRKAKVPGIMPYLISMSHLRPKAEGDVVLIESDYPELGARGFLTRSRFWPGAVKLLEGERFCDLTINLQITPSQLLGAFTSCWKFEP